MSQASDYLENALLAALFQKTSAFGVLSVPPTIRIALCTVAVNDNDTGTSITEPTAGEYNEYARQSTSDSDWSAAAGGVISNATKISFPKCLTGTGATITHFAACDAVSGGNLLFYGTLTTSMPLVVGSTPEFEIGALSAQLS